MHATFRLEGSVECITSIQGVRTVKVPAPTSSECSPSRAPLTRKSVSSAPQRLARWRNWNPFVDSERESLETHGIREREVVMNAEEILTKIEEQSDARGVAHWANRYPNSALRTHGVGLTKLRKLAKSVGRDATLAAELWTSDVYELRVVALLIDDPKALTVEQAERQVDQLGEGQLAHVFASCDATLAKSSIAVDIAESWCGSASAIRRECGHSLVYELSKSKKKSAPTDAWFADRLRHIDASWREEDTDVRMSMATALMGMGKRSATLWPEALRVARDIGPIDFDPTGACDPMDVSKHIDHPRVRQKLGVDI